MTNALTRPNGDEVISIEIKYGMMRVHDGVLKKSRVVWRAPGLEVRVFGPFSGRNYEVAANLAMQECVKRSIPCISLRRVK